MNILTIYEITLVECGELLLGEINKIIFKPIIIDKLVSQIEEEIKMQMSIVKTMEINKQKKLHLITLAFHLKKKTPKGPSLPTNLLSRSKNLEITTIFKESLRL